MKSLPVDVTRLDAFLSLSWKLHAADPAWIPPLRAVEARDLAAQGTFARTSELQMILCEEAGEVLGRMAAIHNPGIPEVGQVGYFESIDDPEVLRSMLEVARPWFAERGVKAVWGPMNGGAHRAHRFMVRGFDREPFLFEPRNPAYYPAVFEANGFRPSHRWHSYELEPAVVQKVCARLARAASRTLRTHTIVPFDLSDPTIMPRLHRILDRTWAGHVGYTQMDIHEFVEGYAGVVAISRHPYLGVVTNERGEDVAIGLSYPDWAAEVRALKGDADGWATWEVGALPKRLVLHTVAVVPEERGGGPALVIVDHAGKHIMADGFEQVVVALVVEEFALFRRFVEPTREYALFERAL